MPEQNGNDVGANSGEILADMLTGAVAGAIGVWVMDQVDWYAYDHEDPEARELTQAVRPHGKDSGHNMVSMAAEAVGLDPIPQPHPIGVAMHYGLGVGPGMLYGAMRDRVPVLGAGRGLLYGFGLFVVQDEAINWAAGFAADPRKYPWQAHARGLLAHLVYGVVTDTVLRVLKGPGRPLRYPRPSRRSGNGSFPTRPSMQSRG